MPILSDAGDVRLQSRDLDLLQGLFESRAMMLRHVTALYFAEKKEAAKKRRSSRAISARSRAKGFRRSQK
jgi:hypothetical protein